MFYCNRDEITFYLVLHGSIRRRSCNCAFVVLFRLWTRPQIPQVPSVASQVSSQLSSLGILTHPDLTKGWSATLQTCTIISPAATHWNTWLTTPRLWRKHLPLFNFKDYLIKLWIYPIAFFCTYTYSNFLFCDFLAPQFLWRPAITMEPSLIHWKWRFLM